MLEMENRNTFDASRAESMEGIATVGLAAFSMRREEWNQIFSATAQDTASTFLPTIKFDFTKHTASDTTKESKESQESQEIPNSPELQAKLDGLDETQRKAYEDMMDAIKRGDVNAAAEIVKRFEDDPSKFDPVYKCVQQAIRDGQVKDIALIYKYDADNNTVDFKLKIGDQRVAVRIGDN